MKIRTGLAILAIASVMSGCASLEWKRPYNDTEEAFRADSNQCRYEIELGYQQYQTGTTRGTGSAIGAGMAAGFGDAIRKNNLMKMCLENKGWRMERAR